VIGYLTSFFCFLDILIFYALQIQRNDFALPVYQFYYIQTVTLKAVNMTAERRDFAHFPKNQT